MGSRSSAIMNVENVNEENKDEESDKTAKKTEKIFFKIGTYIYITYLLRKPMTIVNYSCTRILDDAPMYLLLTLKIMQLPFTTRLANFTVQKVFPLHFHYLNKPLGSIFFNISHNYILSNALIDIICDAVILIIK